MFSKIVEQIKNINRVVGIFIFLVLLTLFIILSFMADMGYRW